MVLFIWMCYQYMHIVFTNRVSCDLVVRILVKSLSPGKRFSAVCEVWLLSMQDAFIAIVFGYIEFYSARFTIFSFIVFPLICPIILLSSTVIYHFSVDVVLKIVTNLLIQNFYTDVEYVYH